MSIYSDISEILYSAVYKCRAQRHNPQKIPAQITRGISDYFDDVVKYDMYGHNRLE